MVTGLAAARCVFVGDCAVGKTSLIQSYLTGKFQKEYSPTVIGHDEKLIEADGTKLSLLIADCSGDDSYYYLRHGVYKSADVVVVCFSIDNQDSKDNVRTKWRPELKQYCPKAQLILLATKSDLRRNPNSQQKFPALIDNAKTTELIIEIEAVSFLECSALLQKGLKDVFEIEIPRAFRKSPKFLQTEIPRSFRGRSPRPQHPEEQQESCVLQ